MIEIRIHGRGGQGGVTLAKLIAATRFLQGDSVQAFGLYAAERSGAPLQAFCRWAREPITNKNLIYEPDHVIVLDPTLIGPAITQGLKAGGWILLNTDEPPAKFDERFPAHRLAAVDATAIALENGLGTRSVPIVNTALAGAVGRLLDLGLESVHAALDHLGFGGGNVTAADSAHERVKMLEMPRQPRAAPPAPAPAPGPTPSFLDGAGGALPGVQTGQWATQRPWRQQMTPPCNHVCPAGNDVRGFLEALAHDRPDEALQILLRTTPFPGVCGRVCPAPCMESCNRIELDGAVNVRQLERYAADHGTATPSRAAERSEQVAVIGSGPAGLAAAYHLALLGYGVTVYEAGAEIGGLLRTGIPGYRLPKDVLDHEVERVLELGVEVKTGLSVDRSGLLELARVHDALLVATGLQELRVLRLGIGESAGVLQGIDFLDRLRSGEVRLDGEEVVVVGGGNTAIDAARSALRLGAQRVLILYRRTRLEMPAIVEEIDRAIEEGVEIEFLTTPVAVSGNGRDPAAAPCYSLTCRRMELGEEDGSGRRRPVEVKGSEFELACNRVILALGQSPDLSVFPEGTEVREGERLLGTLETPVFAVGDLVTGDGTVAAAIGSGRRAALHIHRTLSSEPGEEAGQDAVSARVDVVRDEVIRPEAMKLHLFESQAPAPSERRMPYERSWNFEEVDHGLSDPREAVRCLSCGVCDECDRCVTYCPEGVLKRVGHDFVFDYAYCKGCGVCAAECPRNVVFMSHL